jgi:glycosyltransferase involved in cell wall biosynthesis
VRLLYITPSLGAGGAERQASILLPELQTRGVDARALALDSGGPFVEPLRAAGVPVEVAGMRHRFDWGPLWHARAVRDFAPDVIVSRGVSGIYVGDLLARWRGAAHVYNDHRGVGVELSRRRTAMIAFLARRLTRVILVSPDQCAGWLGYGCPRERIAIIPNGVVFQDIPSSRSAVRRELGLPEDAVVAMMVASLRPVKRVPDFVRAVRRARERCPSLVGVVVGDGVEHRAVHDAAAGDAGVLLLGHRDDVPRLLQAADVAALTSAHEAMPMALLEAMAAGLPVVATDVGGVAGVVADGETGVLVPPRDPEAVARALERLAGDGELRRRMGAAGRERCRRQWNAEAMADSYLEVLSEACAVRRRRRGAFMGALDRRGLVTWEREVPDADVLTVTNYWPDREGPARAPFLRATVDGLTAAGVRTDVLYVRGYKGKHVYLLACTMMAVLPLVRRRKYRLVHSHGGETAVVARFFWGAPVLATYWGSDVLAPRYGDAATRLRVLLRSRMLRLHSMLMTATTTKTVEMERMLPRRVQARNWVIPDGIDLSVFKPVDRGQARAALGWADDEVTVISAGSGPMKRHWLAEQAVALAARELPRLRWRALTDVAPEEMPLCYSAADLLLHTSCSEGSPNVIKEAIACGLPVVATPAGDIAELLDGVEPAVVCEDQPEVLASAVLSIARTGARVNGRDRSHALSVEVASARTLECYRSLGVWPSV